jgi:hypothetical protein
MPSLLSNQFGVLGELVNVGTKPVYNVKVRIRVETFTGDFTTFITGTTALTATLPGQTNTFAAGIYVSGSGNILTPTNAMVVAYDETVPQTYKNATVVSTQSSATPFGVYEFLTISGTVRNDTGSPLNSLSIYAWTLDSDPPTYGFETSQPTLLPGETITFSINPNATLDANDGVGVKVVAQGIVSP